MSTYASPVVKTNRPNLVAVGTIVWLSSELMFFAALFAMYFTPEPYKAQRFGQNQLSY